MDGQKFDVPLLQLPVSHVPLQWSDCSGLEASPRLPVVLTDRELGAWSGHILLWYEAAPPPKEPDRNRKMNIVILLAALAADVDLIDRAQQDERTVWYDTPRVFAAGDTLFRIGASPAPDFPGNPSNHGIWKRPGGCIDAPDSFSFTKGIFAPQRAKVELVRNKTAANRVLRNPDVYRWTWPEGTVRLVKLFDDERHFETHAMAKIDGEWSTRRIKLGEPPEWFREEGTVDGREFSLDDCMGCHQDAGRHASLIDAARPRYYGNVSGSDGAFAPDPREIRGDRWVWNDLGVFDLSGLPEERE